MEYHGSTFKNFSLSRRSLLKYALSGLFTGGLFPMFTSPLTAHAAENSTSLFPLGEQLISPNFSGRVWLDMLVPEGHQLQCPVGNVTFEPGCRNSWHKHPGGQILLVTSGQGYYQERGKPAQALKPGDVVTIAPHVEHWHGASPQAWFAHLAITTQPQAGPAEWLEPVSETAYLAAVSR